MHPLPLLPALALVLALAGCATRGPVVADRLPTPLDIPLDHRSSRLVPGSEDGLLLTIGDITRGQVTTALSACEGVEVMEPRPLRIGDQVSFDWNGHPYRLHLQDVRDTLIGQDTALFRITDPTDDHRRAAEGGREQILTYISRVRAARGAIFIRNGLDYSGEQVAEFLQRKWEHKGDAVRTAEEFLAQVATRSESCGEPYRVVLPEGATVPLAHWLREDAAHATAPSRPKG